MSCKIVLVLCAVLVQTALSQYLGGCGYDGLAGPYGINGFNGVNGFNGINGINGINGFNGINGINGFNGLGAPCGVASTGGGLPVTSSSPIAPVGVSVVSENCYEGPLNVGGNLPFLGTVALEGVLPTAGAGAINYGCGNGAVGIAAEEGPVATGIAPSAGPAPAGYNLGYNGLGYNGLGYNGYPYGAGCGCGAIY